MVWEKLGLVWAPSGETDWARTHATLPVVQTQADGRWWIYVSCRDALGKSRIGRLTLDASMLPHAVPRVLSFDDAPVLSLGAPGAFDDSGVMPSWLVRNGDELRLYYLGWNVIGTVPYRLSIGMATSHDGGVTFQRYSQGPIVDRSLREPFFATAPCVLREDDRWRMWYVSCTGWQETDGRWEPCYHVKYADSADGIDWNITGISCIAAAEGEAVGRPCVIRLEDRYAMIYSRRSILGYRTNPEQSYRLEYAESADGIEWRRVANSGIARSNDGWDSQMIEYCWVERSDNETYLVYNGNGFGYSGVGIARLRHA
jgi:hypothetical protein